MAVPVRILTSFNARIYAASGKKLVESVRQNLGRTTIVAYYESSGANSGSRVALKKYPQLAAEGTTAIDVMALASLQNIRSAHRDVIPVDEGGLAEGPLGDGAGAGWNRRWFQWFRKIAAQYDAICTRPPADPGFLLWMDSDLRVTSPFDGADVERRLNAPIGIMQGTREAAETGFIVFDERRRETVDVVAEIWECFQTGAFKQLPRWDDGYVYGEFAKRRPDAFQDFAQGCDPILHTNGNGHTTGNQILPVTPFGRWLEHDKGLHHRAGVCAPATRPATLIQRVTQLFSR